jgi:hypothetical protein
MRLEFYMLTIRHYNSVYILFLVTSAAKFTNVVKILYALVHRCNEVTSYTERDT